MSIEIANESGYDVDADNIVAVARHALAQMGVNPLAELSVLLVDSDYMAELNHRWMGKEGPTDVLAFPMDEDTIDHGPSEASGGQPALLGDLVLCPEVAAAQAARYGSPDPRMRREDAPEPEVPAGGPAGLHGDYGTADELSMLTIHGVLHLLGYDHAEPEEEREMFALQGKLLDSWQARSGASSK
ncbi:endoribonuclease YbeY [Catellatospora sp. TT07R-123]|uniref:rRNA maturation RNase YbeY n=1 Tax=Catellatospora sp. TT07R-123 TaxID=2733863 RepID=UPI001B2190B6|nr:rRNA maturation RNase YbeY [Catellatospora sp. TT07R-123]GHJ45393.1 endoribonuclease YbeY [Catellatospora sp. TT07R-123]